MKDEVIAIACSDIHLSHSPPAARSAEPDWYAAMGRYLAQLRELKEEYDCPIICAGDVFDLWHSKPELINWAVDALPEMYAIPGQHDMPNHSYEDIHRSAYWTLVKAGKIVSMESWDGKLLPGVGQVYAFRYGAEIRAPRNGMKDRLKIAVVHSYIWTPGHSYLNPETGSKAKHWRARLTGFDLAIFGDNHKGFLAKVGNCEVINCGCLFPRKSDEIDYRPSVGLVRADGTVVRHMLDCVEDMWLTDWQVCGQSDGDDVRVARMLEGLLDWVKADSIGLDFDEALKEALSRKGIRPGARKILAEASEASR